MIGAQVAMLSNATVTEDNGRRVAKVMWSVRQCGRLGESEGSDPCKRRQVSPCEESS